MAASSSRPAEDQVVSTGEDPELDEEIPASAVARSVDYGILPECIGFNLRISYGEASQLFARVFEEGELAPIQFAALEFISRNPQLSQRELAEYIGTTPSVLVQPLERLEKRGLIFRVRSADDRRRSRIRLTGTGARLLETAREKVREVERLLTVSLSPAERETLLHLLRKMRER